MQDFSKHLKSFYYASIIVSFFFFATSSLAGMSTFPYSPDKVYKAEKIYENGVHFKIVNTETGQEVFVTKAKYPTPNDVKAGGFFKIDGDNGTYFACVYHYGHTVSSYYPIYKIVNDEPEFVTTKSRSGYSYEIDWLIGAFK